MLENRGTFDVFFDARSACRLKHMFYCVNLAGLDTVHSLVNYSLQI